MRALIIIVCGFLIVSCTTKKDTHPENGERSTSSQSNDSTNNNAEDARQIRLWDARTAEGTELGELPEVDTDESGEDVVEADILGVSSMLHKASLRCNVLHVTVNKSASPQTLSATCDGAHVFGPVKTSTGPGGRTPVGTFTVFNRIKMAYSGAYNNAPMARFLVFKDCGSKRPNCIGIHATVAKNYPKLGTPASKGCVRLTMDNAVALWNLSHESGTTKVTVK